MITASRLSASTNKITGARTANESIDSTDKGAQRVVARGMVKNAKENGRIERCSVVYVHNNGDHWEVINPPSVQAAFVSLRPQDGAIQSLVGGFDFEEDRKSTRLNSSH